MNKLARLKEWLTPTDVARQLTISLKAPCSAADVLQLGLDKRLVLSVRFLSPVPLLRISASMPGDQEQGTQQNPTGERRTSTTAEIYDLPLVGSERASVEARWRALPGHRQLSTPPAGPAYVRSRDGDLWQLPFRGLPHDCEIVVRSEEVAALEGSEGATTQRLQADLSEREKTILLKVIAAACHEGKIDLAERRAGKRIIGAADLLGLGIGQSTVYKVLQEVREILQEASRSHNSR